MHRPHSLMYQNSKLLPEVPEVLKIRAILYNWKTSDPMETGSFYNNMSKIFWNTPR